MGEQVWASTAGDTVEAGGLGGSPVEGRDGVGGGGCFAYLRVELGEFVAFIATGNILLEYIKGGSAVSCYLTSYFATCCNQPSDKFFIIAHGLTSGYNQLDPMVVTVLVAVALLAIFSTNACSRLNYIASIVHISVLLFIIIAGLTKANPNNYSTFISFGTHGIFEAEAVLFFAYVVSDAVSTMAEENKNPERDTPLALIGSITITALIYCPLAVTVSGRGCHLCHGCLVRLFGSIFFSWG